MIRISSNVQSQLSASNQINNYNRATEELVCNALDAGATSIAIRINIQANTIQVIDNGCGVSCKDYDLIGQKHTTSKFTDLCTLKSAPDKYGLRGQALANIINVSKSVKIISRHENSEEAWMKLFEYGTKKQISKCTARPSMGTTLEITGFLYNLDIQKKSKDTLGDLQSIKTFLEHLSLIHFNVSLSLRDDSKNEIVFQMHKNRNIYQTLSALYGIDRNNFQELKVEKNEYKVTAYFWKCDEIGKHFIFLNGKFILNSSRLHEIVDSNFSKQSKQSLQKSKIKNMNIENKWIQNKIPDYFIFIICPLLDYNLSNSPKQSVLEFKNWNQINSLLEKLVKFSNGDMNLKNRNQITKNQAQNIPEYSDTRTKVKKIMDNILTTHSNNPGVSHMHNAIKGRQARRKTKKLSLKPAVSGSNSKKNHDFNSKSINDMVNINKPSHSHEIKESNINKKTITKKIKKDNIKSCLETNRENIGSEYNSKFKKVSYIEEPSIPQNKNINKEIINKRKIGANKDEIVAGKSQIKTNKAKKRCETLHRKTSNKRNQMHKKCCIKFLNEYIPIKNIPKTHVNISVRKKIDEIVIHHNASEIPKRSLGNENEPCDNDNVKKTLVQSNYDLLQTILDIQQKSSVHINNSATELNNIGAIMSPPRITRVVTNNPSKLINIETDNNRTDPVITFNSHNYYTRQNYNTENNENKQNENRRYFYQKPRTFITEQSIDNFLVPNVLNNNVNKEKRLTSRFSKQFQSQIRTLLKKSSKLFNLKNQIMGNTSLQSSYTIEFTESNICQTKTNKDAIMTDESRNIRMSMEKILPRSQKNYAAGINDRSINTDTKPKNVHNGYTINNDEKWAFHATSRYTIENTSETIGNESQNQNNKINGISQDRNFIFISKSLEHDQDERTLDPIDVCQTVFHSEEILNREFGHSFNDKHRDLSNNHNSNIQNIETLNSYNKNCLHSKENAEILEEQNDHAQKILNITPDNSFEVLDHFSPNKQVTKVNNINQKMKSPIFIARTCTNLRKQTIEEKSIGIIGNKPNYSIFNITNRPSFVPKGLSPIFQNCKTKNVCKYNLSNDYYEQEMYNNFVDDVRHNAEIFEATIQDAKEITTKAIDKVNAKITKDSSDLKFDGQSLRDAKVKTSRLSRGRFEIDFWL